MKVLGVTSVIDRSTTAAEQNRLEMPNSVGISAMRTIPILHQTATHEIVRPLSGNRLDTCLMRNSMNFKSIRRLLRVVIPLAILFWLVPWIAGLFLLLRCAGYRTAQTV